MFKSFILCSLEKKKKQTINIHLKPFHHLHVKRNVVFTICNHMYAKIDNVYGMKRAYICCKDVYVIVDMYKNKIWANTIKTGNTSL